MLEFKVHHQQILYDGFHRLEMRTLVHQRFDGSMMPPITRELVVKNACAAVLPYDPIRQKIILIEQFRAGAMDDPLQPWLLEIVAGILDPGEHPADTAVREAREEANCRITNLLPIAEYFSTPGSSTEKVYLYCGITDLRTIKPGHICGLPEEQEEIRTHLFSIQEVPELLHQHRIRNATTLVALQWLLLNQHTFNTVL